MTDTPWREPDPITANRINTRFATLQATVNALPPEAIQPRTLNNAQIESAISNVGTPVGSFVKTNTNTTALVVNEYPGYGLDTYLGDTPVAGVGWCGIIGAAQVSFTPRRLGLGGGSETGKLLVLANLRVNWIRDPAVTVNSAEWKLMVAIMWYNDTTNAWTLLDRTERATGNDIELEYATDPVNATMRKDISIRTLITDFDTGVNDIQSVQIVVSMFADGEPVLPEAEIQHYELTVIPLYCAA